MKRVALIVVVFLGLAAGLFWFQPWRLATDTTVRESLAVVEPTASAKVVEPTASAKVVEPTASAKVAEAPRRAAVLAQGTFVTHEHETTGRARLVRNADGSHQVELIGLDTSDGPDLRVWLTDRPVVAGRDGWGVFDDGEHIELGRLKGNHGDQVYALDASVDPADFRSVSIWCKRFSVSFGAAALA